MRRIISTVALLALGSLASPASAQAQSSQVQSVHAPRVHTVQPQPNWPGRPMLGVQVVSTGSSLEVTSVRWNSPASRLGLEAGDRIVQINGRSVRSVSDLAYCLEDAANYNNGQIRVLIDNVRARYGLPGQQRFVSHATYLDGFSGLAGLDPNAGPVYAAAPQP